MVSQTHFSKIPVLFFIKILPTAMVGFELISLDQLFTTPSAGPLS